MKTSSGVFVVSKEADALAKGGSLAAEPTEEAAEPADPQTHFFKTLQLKKGPEKSNNSEENAVNGVRTGYHGSGGAGNKNSFTKTKVLDTCDKMAVLKIPRLDMTKKVSVIESEKGQGKVVTDKAAKANGK
jgi:hypothetical protein